MKEIWGTPKFFFVLNLSTAIPNRNYRDSKTLNRGVVSIAFLISLRWVCEVLCLLNNCLLYIWHEETVIFDSFKFSWSKRWCYLVKNSSLEAAISWSRVIPCDILKTTHNYLIFIFYHHFFINFLVISGSIELIFD